MARNPYLQDYNSSKFQLEKFNMNLSYLTELNKHIIIFNEIRGKMSEEFFSVPDGVRLMLEVVDIIDSMAYPKCRHMPEFKEANTELTKLKAARIDMYVKGSDGKDEKYYPQKANELKEKIQVLFRTYLGILEEKGLLTMREVNVTDVMGQME